MSRYLHGELRASSVGRLEDHLLDCGECRALLVRIRTGDSFMQRAPRLRPQNDRWAAIEAAIGPENSRPLLPARDASEAAVAESAAAGRVRPVRVALAGTLVALSIAVAAIGVLYGRLQTNRNTPTVSVALDVDEFHPVSISEMNTSTKPHVVAEGYVTDLRNEEDGDLVFKLVDNPDDNAPFIICEIIDPIRLEPPPVGSLVRVYGVSRYDNQENHHWYEVHPVLNIEVVRR
jgi:hypothetical protein